MPNRDREHPLRWGGVIFSKFKNYFFLHDVHIGKATHLSNRLMILTLLTITFLMRRRRNFLVMFASTFVVLLPELHPLDMAYG